VIDPAQPIPIYFQLKTLLLEEIRATIDLGEIEREREREPALRLRRPSLYS
jgi:hypothetical protein